MHEEELIIILAQVTKPGSKVYVSPVYTYVYLLNDPDLIYSV